MGETMKRLAVVGWLLVAAGCSTVTVKEPFGEPASPDEREALLGVWLGEDGGSVEIRQTKEGALTAGMLVWDEEKEQFRAQTTNLTATEIDGNRFLLSEVIEGDRAGRFWFFRYDQPDEKTIRLFLPDVAAFKRVVELVERRREAVSAVENTTTSRSTPTTKPCENFSAARASPSFSTPSRTR